MTLVLGIDGGGTKTHAVIADAEGPCAGSRPAARRTGRSSASAVPGESLREATRRALEAAGAESGDLGGRGFGLAGIDWDSDMPRMAAEAEQLGLAGRPR